MVLPPDCRRLEAVADPELVAILRAAGFELADGAAEAPPDAKLVDVEGGGWRDVLPGATDAPVLTAVAVGGGRRGVPREVSRPLRAVQLLASPVEAIGAALQARRVARAFRRAGLEASSLPTGDRSRVYGIGRGSWRRVRRLPVGAIVTGSRAAPVRSTAALAFEAASRELGKPLSWRSAMVLESGKTLIDVGSDDGPGYVLWVAGYPSRKFLDKSIDCVGAIGANGPPPAIRDRIAWPLTTGEVGLARYSLEPKLEGVHPRRMTTALWRDCMEFLIALHTLGRSQPAAGSDAAAFEPFVSDLAVLERHAREGARATLASIAAELTDRLAGVPLGWSHADFWNQNLLVRDGRLRGVLDWDLSNPRSLPLLDLMDLIVVGQRRGRALGPGPRFARMLWPLAEAGGDERTREYCAGTGTPGDRHTLEALAVSYWIVRLARRLRAFRGDTTPPSQWLADNLHDPLALLARSSFVGGRAPAAAESGGVSSYRA